VRRNDAVVAAQLACLAGLAWPGRPRWPLPRPVVAASAAATATGAALLLAGAASQGRRLTPRVDPPAGARLLTRGPYALSRHPMYAGLLLAGAGVAVLRRRVEPLLAEVGLAAVLHVKSGLEERSLRARFGAAYDEYAATVPRLAGLPRR
jgi:protein-S-isoprenylcysteine O-methyltransferase Ste14